MVIHLGRLLPNASCNLPGRLAWKRGLRRLSRHPSSLFGLAPGGVYRAATVASDAVRSYRTLSPLPRLRTNPKTWRFAFCGTFPGVTPAGRYPAPCLRGARTFLYPGVATIRRSGTMLESTPLARTVKRYS